MFSNNWLKHFKERENLNIEIFKNDNIIKKFAHILSYVL